MNTEKKTTELRSAGTADVPFHQLRLLQDLLSWIAIGAWPSVRCGTGLTSINDCVL